jgi:hypothetical protein
MSSIVSLSTQLLATAGCAMLKQNLSLRLLKSLARGFPNQNPSELALVRQVFDGLPMRIVQGLIGEVILSAIKYGCEQGWRRSRIDTVASGAPAEFVPGFDLATVIDQEACRLEFLPGSGRLTADSVYPTQIARSVELAAGDLAILDSRLVRRWPDDRRHSIYMVSVVRFWLTPQQDFSGRISADLPSRALRFFGAPWQPAREIGQWLFHNHPERSS